MKISNDKYYTPECLANWCWSIIRERYHRIHSNISTDIVFDRIIEPSCGNGAFFHTRNQPTLAFDIEPELDNPCVIKGDYLAQDLKYELNTLVIGNPPYGSKMSLAIQFFKKSVEIADTIAFVLPISQLNNNRVLYEFDLVYSKDLGIVDFLGRKLHCCFNIYDRPINGLHKKPSNKVDDITIYRQDCKDYDKKSFDVRMCYWGNGSAGKILKDGEHYSGEYKIVINNKALYSEIYKVLTTFDWNGFTKGIAMKRLKQYQIIDVLKEKVKGFGEKPKGFFTPKI